MQILRKSLGPKESLKNFYASFLCYIRVEKVNEFLDLPLAVRIIGLFDRFLRSSTPCQKPLSRSLNIISAYEKLIMWHCIAYGYQEATQRTFWHSIPRIL